MIKTQMIGHIGQDATTRDVNGMTAISFNVASTEKYKNKNGELVSDTTWAQCTIWRKSDQLGIVQYLKKGTQVYIEGKPSASAFISKQSSEAMAQLNIRVNDLKLLGSANQTQQQNTPVSNNTPPPTQSTGTGISLHDDDLPF